MFLKRGIDRAAVDPLSRQQAQTLSASLWLLRVGRLILAVLYRWGEAGKR
jgi:hypothetical protein